MSTRRAAAPSDEGLPARLRALRSAMGLSQEQLARQLDVSFATVNRWESGRTRISASAGRRFEALEERSSTAGQRVGAPPWPHSSFVGRTAELAELRERLADNRLVCLSGPGGVGKTRLALEAIRRSDSALPVRFVALEPIHDPTFLSAAVAAALGVHDQPALPTIEAIEAALVGSAHLLLLLDGAEQLRDEVAELVRRLLTAVPELRILVTSRRVLGVVGEAACVVPPLAVAPIGASVAQLNSADSVQLFMTRARERLPGFATGRDDQQLVADLCRRLDGLPLAIELMAGWVGTLSISEIAERRESLLASGPGESGLQSSRTLESVAAQSFALLGTAGQRLLLALSTFAGPFTIDDAQVVADIEADEVARLLRELVDSSWLIVRHEGNETRFRMLETVRAHLAGRLLATGEGPELRRRHAEHFAELARGSEEGLTGAKSTWWADRMDVANPDIELALWWSQEEGATDLGLEMSARLWRWWLMCGRLTVGRGWLSTFLRAAGRRRDEEVAYALSAAAVLAAENGDYADAVSQATVALGIFEGLGRRELAAFAGTVLGSAQRYLGDGVAARRNFQAAMALRDATRDRRGVAVALNNLALLALDDDDLAAARDLFEQALVIKRQIGDPRSVAIGLANLSDVLIRAGQLSPAERALGEAARLARELDNRQLIGTIRCNQGDVAAARQDWSGAAEHYRAAVVVCHEGGHTHDVVNALIGLSRALHQLGRDEEAAERLRKAESLAAETGNAQGLAAARGALADLGEETVVALPDGLTVRQAEVLGLVAAGSSNKEIASSLYLSVSTVERHLANIYRKLDLRSRVEATRYAVAHGLAAKRDRRPRP
ncbi:MAG: LuxR C-terminal-related transcriptional regulator [Acidimicrobiales bacterium]